MAGAATPQTASTRAATVALVLLLAGCGAPAPSPTLPDSHPVDFGYELDGETRRVADLRGRPLLLVLIRTSELPSQVHVGEVKEAFEQRAGEVRFLVLTVEATEAPFVEPYVEANELPFSVGIAERAVVEGASPLGLVPVIPTTYLIDEDGRTRDAAAGTVSAELIVDAIDKQFRR